MKKVIVFGTFDIFHEGHRNFLRQAKEHGDFLRAVVARDVTVAKVKGRAPENDEYSRLETVRMSGLVDEAVLGNIVDKYQIIREFKPDVVCLGYDQDVDFDKLKKVLNESDLSNVEVIKLKSHKPEKYKSSFLRKTFKKNEI